MKCLSKKDLLLLAKKLIQNILDTCNVAEVYQSFLG